MKICYVNPTFLVRRPIAELIGKLAKRKGNKIGLLIPKKPFRELEGKWHSDFNIGRAKIYTYSAINIPFINFEWPIPVTPMFFINLFRVFWSYDVVHLWTYFYIISFFTVIYGIFARKTRLIMSCDTFPAYSFKPGAFTGMLFRIYTFLFGWFLFSVPDRIHIYGKSILKYAVKAGVKEEKTTAIPTGVNFEKLSKAVKIKREELGLSNSDFVLVYAGLIVPRKGIDIMLKAVKMISKKQKNVKLLLVGEGPSKEKFKNMAKSLGIGSKVVFLGWRKDIPRIMKSADVLILPSRGEGLPGIVMEAMAAGLPVVASDIPCIPDLIEDKVSGFLCPKDDVKCFAERVIDAKKDSRRIAGNASSKIAKLRWENLLDKYERMYKNERKR